MSNVAATSLIGSTLGEKYVIEALIGEGATGKVYRAYQTSLQRTVAIKVLHRQLAEQPAFVQRFQREAFSASRLDHPNSLRVLDFGASDGLLYLVMEFAQGDDLLTVMVRDWPFDARRIVDVMSQALAALATAHDLGIVHRDLKPENILLLKGTDDEGKPTDLVKVCDFGIAKLMGPSSQRSGSFSRSITTEGFVVGTPDYMSPEQARGQELDGRSDLYTMGVVLYQLLAGALPFASDTPLGVALQHISDPPPRPSSHANVNPRLEAICMRALSKDPADRYQSARDMRRALRAALDLDTDRVSGLPMGRTTDMTSVPAASAARPSLHPAFRPWQMARLLRRPATRSQWAAVVVAAVVGFSGLSFAVRGFSKPGTDDRTVGATTTETVLATPSPPITDPLPAPTSGAAAIPGDDPASAARGFDRAEPRPDRSHSDKTDKTDKTAVRSSAIGSQAPAGAATPDGKIGSPAVAPSHAAPGQAAAPGSTEALVRPALAGSEGAARVADAPPRPSAPPVQAINVAPPAPEPVAAPATSAPDPSRASVSIGTIATTGGISSTKVRAAIARVPFTACYRKSLATRSSAAPMDATLHITIDVSGRVSGATLSSDGNLPGLRACIESAAGGLSIRDVDTGDGSATIALTFAPR